MSRFEQVHEGHPLLGRRPEPIGSWVEWLAAVELAKFSPALVGLLHAGLDVPMEGFDVDRLKAEAARVAFYLGAADCHWMAARAFRTAEERESGDPDDPVWDCRRQAARKAFTILGARFFSKWSQSQVRQAAMHPVALSALLHFFRADTDSVAYRVWNLGDPSAARDVRRDQASEFALELCKLTLLGRWKTGVVAEEAAAAPLVPKVVPILIGLGKLLELLRISEYRNRLNTRCVEAIEEAAFQTGPYTDHKVGTGVTMRRPYSLEEAVERGTPAVQEAAMSLTLLRQVGIGQTWCKYEHRDG